MNCDCITKVDTKLKEAGYEYRIAASIVFGKKMEADTMLAIETYWIESVSRRRKKPPPILCTFCPFCGTKAVKPDTSADASSGTT